MDINAQFPSKYLAASDFAGPHDMIMSTVKMETLGTDSKPVLYFQNVEKGLVLNITNSNTIRAIYGGETDRWIGQPITLYPTTTEYRGEMKACIRVQPAQQQAQQPATAAPAFGSTGTAPPQQATIPPANTGQPPVYTEANPPPQGNATAAQLKQAVDDEIPFAPEFRG